MTVGYPGSGYRYHASDGPQFSMVLVPSVCTNFHSFKDHVTSPSVEQSSWFSFKMHF